MKLSAIKYILLFLAQVAVWNYFNFTQYLWLVYLPALILCLPLEYGTVRAMVVAFLTGLAADFLVTGQLGMTSLALVPVALMRQSVVRLAFGSELFARGEGLPAGLSLGGRRRDVLPGLLRHQVRHLPAGELRRVDGHRLPDA